MHPNVPQDDHYPEGFNCRWSTCSMNWPTLAHLVEHITDTHVTSQHGSYHCMWQGCTRNKGFNARYKMLIHIRTHTNERPYECDECGKRFSRQENLRIHLRTHTGEKPYVCAVPGCGKAYSNSSDRFKHSRTHQVEKPYECRFPGCPKRYTDPSSLRKHVKIYGHSNKKLDDSSMTNIPPPSISPMSSGSSSLGASPVPQTSTPPSLLPPSFFPSSNPALPTVGNMPIPSPITTAAWTVALQQIHSQTDSLRQYQIQTEMFLRGGNGMPHMDLNFPANGMVAYHPYGNANIDEEDENQDDDDMEEEEVAYGNMNVPNDSTSALDLSTYNSPLDLSMPSARRRYQ